MPINICARKLNYGLFCGAKVEKGRMSAVSLTIRLLRTLRKLKNFKLEENTLLVSFLSVFVSSLWMDEVLTTGLAGC